MKAKTWKLPPVDTTNAARLKRLARFADPKTYRYMGMRGVKVEVDRAVVTDGWVLHAMKGSFAEYTPGIYVVDAKGTATAMYPPAPFPEWEYIIPARNKENVFELLDLAVEIRRASNAAIMAGDGHLVLASNPDGTLGYIAWNVSAGQAEVGVKPGARVLGAVDADYWTDTLRLHAASEATGVRVQVSPNAKTPTLLESHAVMSLIMPAVKFDAREAERRIAQLVGLVAGACSACVA
jgi:hypothetical protein